ncbi:diguanylate cyclase [Pelagibacterium limicola]|uniref:diguanylate cyclase n=1 Tax=Pelagibacterium limicola TaxID=2791022 RepID=UPI0018AFDB8E|nr:diguanylate cyclase [Pelagibacterium limicola]
MEKQSAKDSEETPFLFGRSGALLRRIIDNAALGMAVAGMDGAVVYKNAAFAKDFLLRNTPDEPRLLLNVFDSDDTVVRDALADLFAGRREEYGGEHCCRAPNGRMVWAVIAVSVLRSDQTGDPLYVVAQFSSIDRRKRAEAALAESESRWHFALEAARQGVWDHDNRTKTMFYSPMWYKMRGIPPGEKVDDSQEGWLSRLHPEDRQRIRGVVGKQNTGEDGYDILEYRERHREGHYVWILSRGKPVEWDENGEVLRTVGTDTDITHLKEIEAQLAAEKERWRVTLASIADATICVDMRGHITFMNAAAVRWLGLDYASAEDRFLPDVLTIDTSTPDACAVLLQRCLETGETARLEEDAVLVAVDGGRRDIRFSVSAVRPDNGTPLGAVIVLQDVTRSRSLQRQLEYAASHDGLTGLRNRAAFHAELALAAREAQPGCLLFIDLDHFKPINDNYGHAAGDDLLRQIARIIQSEVRRGDICARLGGDEFAVLLYGCTVSDAAAVGAKLCRAIANVVPIGLPAGVRVGASIGLAVIESGASPDAILKRADAACYDAKRNGRGRVAGAN